MTHALITSRTDTFSSHFEVFEYLLLLFIEVLDTLPIIILHLGSVLWLVAMQPDTACFHTRRTEGIGGESRRPGLGGVYAQTAKAANNACCLFLLVVLCASTVDLVYPASPVEAYQNLHYPKFPQATCPCKVFSWPLIFHPIPSRWVKFPDIRGEHLSVVSVLPFHVEIQGH